MSLVSFLKVGQPHHDQLKQAIVDSLNLIHYRLPSKLQEIVIKPNMCYYWDYSTGQTTDSRFVGALIDAIRDQTSQDVNISIVESDASAMKCKYAFKMLGYGNLARRYNVELINLSEDKSDTVEVKVGGRQFRLKLPQTIQKADLRINVPKIKYAMERIKITCALKNIFGCNPYPQKFRYHSELEEAIVAINKAMKFDLCIIDGIIAAGVQSRRLGLVMASKDPVAIDAAAAKIAGINPRTIGYLQLAAKEGLGNTNFISKGMPLRYFGARYPRKNIQKKLVGRAYELTVTLGLGKRLGLA